MDVDVDVLIVGGGLTGCALALALRHSALRVALVESQAPQSAAANFDERHLGLAEVSVQSLLQLGVWPRIGEAIADIQAIHVSSQGEFGHCVLRAVEHGVARFGATCPARALGLALNDAVAALPALRLQRPARLLDLQAGDAAHQVTLEVDGAQQQLRARLVVGADGSHSRIRELAGIAAHSDDSGQIAIVSNVQTERPHAGMAFERFTRHGPIAMLPLPGNRCGAVWTQDAAQAQSHLQLGDAAFLEALQSQFGYRLGRLTRLGRRASHALVRVSSASSTAPRIALIGNAAQALHPIAAQGFNLGLRDALGLAAAVMQGADDPGSAAVLEAFAADRQRDRESTRSFSQNLLQITTHPALGALRSAGLLALDALSPLRSRLVQFGMGYGRA